MYNTTTVMTDIVVRQLPLNVLSLVDAGFSETLYSSALSILTAHLTAKAPLSIYTIPPPSHLSLLVTMLVHPSTTNTPFRKQASQLLSRVLDVVTPREAKFDQVFQDSRKRKRREFEDEDEEEECELEREGLMNQAESIWHIIEFAFFKSEGGWVDLLSLIVRVLRKDFDACKTAGLTAIERSIIYKWLSDSSGKCAFPKAIRAIFATRGGEMMLDSPREIYEQSTTQTTTDPEQNDIWGGSILLHHRIDLLTMVYELSRLHPKFLKQELFLEALQRHFLSPQFDLDQLPFSQFLSTIQSVSFRTQLCVFVAERLSPDAVRRFSHRRESLGPPDLAVKISRGFLLTLPPKKGKDPASDLAKYCVVTGLILRGWMMSTKGKGKGQEEMRGAVEQAILLREERCQELKGSKMEVEKVLRREEVMLRAFVRKLEIANGVA